MAGETKRRVQYLAVQVKDEPGAAAKLLMPIQQAGINLLAFHAFPRGGGEAQVDLFAEDVTSLKRVAEKGGAKVSEPKTAFLIQGEDRTGAVLSTLMSLSEARINCVSSSACAAGERYGMLLWVGDADLDRAAKIIGV